MHNQFRNARKNNTGVQEAFEENDKLGVRQGKNKNKEGLLIAWLQDTPLPSFKHAFMVLR